jgi:hypothetical protein
MENLLPSCDQFCIFVQNLSELLKLTLNKLKIRIIFSKRELLRLEQRKQIKSLQNAFLVL